MQQRPTSTWVAFGRWVRRHKVISAVLALWLVLVQAPLAGAVLTGVVTASSEFPEPAAAVEARPTAEAEPTPEPPPEPRPGRTPSSTAERPTPSQTPSPSAEPTSAPSTEPPVEPTDVGAGTALATVALLDVKGRAPRTGYDRALFGSGWVDVDRNGCDTRNDMLARDLAAVTVKAGTHDCVVLTGVLVDPYSGRTIHFERGEKTSRAVQIDHVVALSDAWQKGAQQWGETTRVAFANDPLNLLAVDGPLNAQKGDGDTATWLPPDKAYRCAYVARQVAVKHAYSLWVTPAEGEAMVRVLSACPDEPLPSGAGGAGVVVTSTEPVPAPTPAPAPEPDPAPTPAPASASAPAPAPAPPPAPAPALDPDMGTCKAAKAAGLGPYVQGVHPEYDWYRDADKDGTVCE